MNLSYFLSVKNMLEVLQHDHITVNTTIYCYTAIAIHEQMTIGWLGTKIYFPFETRKLALDAG